MKGIGFFVYKSLLISIFLFISTKSSAQNNKENKSDTIKTVMAISVDSKSLDVDTTHQSRENAPLDIADNRGLYIVADSRMVQMRILGSVRFSAFYDFQNLESDNSFNTYEIPTGDDNYYLPNYYNSLNFSRLGFEVTRRTKEYDFFIRLEMDFAGQNNSFRIRHAYGKYGRYLVGQTWSLITNVGALPATVDPNGPVGAVSGRTPQLRVTHKFSDKLRSAFALEYSLPDFISPDSVSIVFVQTIPNVTARFNTDGNYGSVQVAAILAPITGVIVNGNKSTSFGYGVSISGIFNLKNNDQLLYQGTFGNAIAHFVNPFSGSGQDMSYDASTEKFKGIGVMAGFVSFKHNWFKNIASYLSFGIAPLLNREFEAATDYNFSYNASVNGFWMISDGLRIGLEYLYGQRYNINNERGSANRVWALFYYDF
jgi:hypothetical protein